MLRNMLLGLAIVAGATAAQAGPLSLDDGQLDRITAGQTGGEDGCACGGGGNSGNIGIWNRGIQNIGILNCGRQNIGIDNRGRQNIGIDNRGRQNIGIGNEGSQNIGIGLSGSGKIGIGSGFVIGNS